MSKKHMGSSIDDFLKEEGIFEEVQNQAIKEVVAWQLAQAMKEKKISKNRMATLLKTSRTQVDRLLDTKNDVTLSSLQRAATKSCCYATSTSRQRIESSEPRWRVRCATGCGAGSFCHYGSTENACLILFKTNNSRLELAAPCATTAKTDPAARSAGRPRQTRCTTMTIHGTFPARVTSPRDRRCVA